MDGKSKETPKYLDDAFFINLLHIFSIWVLLCHLILLICVKKKKSAPKRPPKTHPKYKKPPKVEKNEKKTLFLLAMLCAKTIFLMLTGIMVGDGSDERN